MSAADLASALAIDLADLHRQAAEAGLSDMAATTWEALDDLSDALRYGEGLDYRPLHPGQIGEVQRMLGALRADERDSSWLAGSVARMTGARDVARARLGLAPVVEVAS